RPVDLAGKAMDVAGDVDDDEGPLVAARQHETGCLQRVHESLGAVGLAVAGGDGLTPVFDRKARDLSHRLLGLARRSKALEALCSPVFGKTWRQRETELRGKLLSTAPELLPVMRKLNGFHPPKV